MSALGEASFPVPKMYLFCEDRTIMGQEFYVMEYIKVKDQNTQSLLPRCPDRLGLLLKQFYVYVKTE